MATFSNTRKLAAAFAAFVTILYGNHVHAADCAEVIDTWLEKVRGNPAMDIGPAMVMPEFQQIEACGPNALPVIIDRLDKEQDFVPKICLEAAVRRIGKFVPYVYSNNDQAKTHTGQSLKKGNNTPEFSRKWDDSTDTLKPASENDLSVVAWWNRRGSFLKGSGTKTRLSAIGGKGKKLTTDKTRELEAQHPYGIYGIPALIELIADDNNATAFLEFLRTSGSAEYAGICPTGVWVECVESAQAKYPTVQDKMKVVCSWWTEKSSTYTALTDLHSAIDAVVKAKCK